MEMEVASESGVWGDVFATAINIHPFLILANLSAF
jgi:hypothetical protein